MCLVQHRKIYSVASSLFHISFVLGMLRAILQEKSHVSSYICVEQTFAYSRYGLCTLIYTDIETVRPTNANTDADADNFTNIDNNTNLH